MTKPDELRHLTVDELKGKVATLEKELFEFRQKAIQGSLEKISQIRSTRKEIARIHTILKEKSVEQAKN